ncbi:MAG TPA: DinB family protein [Gemmatimonadaceae bacterium]|nr:DinB family protein [Gemmatimonadaceae bacterium]
MEFSLERAVPVLDRTPRVLRDMLGGLPAEWTEGTEGGESWSPYVVVGHLIHGERTDWIPRAEIILAQGPQRRFTPYDRFAQFTESKGKTLPTLLDEFAELRAGNLATLRGWKLTDQHLALEGEHPAFGAVTLRQLLASWVVHDLGHIVQVARTMAKQYADAIGPWREYLPVVDR